MLIATWVGVGAIIVLNGLGLYLALRRQSRNEAAHMGSLNGQLQGLQRMVNALREEMGQRVSDTNRRLEKLELRLEERMNKFEERLTNFLTNWPGDISD